MAARFTKKNFIKHHFSGVYVSMLLFVVLFLFFLYMVGNISNTTIDRQEESLNNALNRAIVSCYSVEGTYPPSLEYIKEHYGLVYDEETFYIDYTAIGSNIYPDVTVLRRNED